jgi:hypothetical protein
MDKLSWLRIQVILAELTWEDNINIWQQMAELQLWHERTGLGFILCGSPLDIFM